jgi:hypothetical protein
MNSSFESTFPSWVLLQRMVKGNATRVKINRQPSTICVFLAACVQLSVVAIFVIINVNARTYPTEFFLISAKLCYFRVLHVISGKCNRCLLCNNTGERFSTAFFRKLFRKHCLINIRNDVDGIFIIHFLQNIIG